MGSRVGSSFFGSPDPQVSTSDIEIIQPNKPIAYPAPKLKAYRFNFMNNQTCHIKLNGSDNQIYLSANQGFETDMYDAELWSFIIIEAGISYYYVGGY
ncbi:MAG TPA: hypothetical protein VIM42_10095 [Clostridium sp.]